MRIWSTSNDGHPSTKCSNRLTDFRLKQYFNSARTRKHPSMYMFKSVYNVYNVHIIS